MLLLHGELQHARVGRSASAQVGHGFVDVCIGGFGFSFKQRCGGHEHATLAVTALRYLLGNPSQLQGVRFFGGAQ